MRRTLALAAVVLAACSATAPPSTTTAAASPTERAGRIVASGEVDLPAATAFGQPGFHEVLAFTAALPADVAGRTLVLRLRDASRTGQTCGSDHPLSGCATVDWSDDPGRPKVPAGGVFENSLTLRAGSRSAVLRLRSNGRLTAAPEPFEPG